MSADADAEGTNADARWDFTVAEEDLLWSLECLMRSGKIPHVGLSDAPAWVVASAHAVASLRGWQRCTAIQLEYSLKERTGERDLLPMAAAGNLAVTAWSPLASGALSAKYVGGTPATTRLAAGYPIDVSDRTSAIARTVHEMASAHGCTAAQVALAWLLSRRSPRVIPIVGARSVAQLEENFAAAGVTLTADDTATLDAATAVPLGFPHDFLRGDLAQFALWGNVGSRVRR